VAALVLAPSPATVLASDPSLPTAARKTQTHQLFIPFVYGSATLAPVSFSQPTDFYDAPFTLRLTSSSDDAVIRYTTDGSRPTRTHGTLYHGPLTIEGTTVMRAAAFGASERQSAVTTRSFIFLDDVVRVTDKSAEHMGFPKTWGKYTEWRLEGQDVPARYEMHQGLVNMDRQAVKDALRALPALSIVASRSAVFGKHGIYSNPLQEGLEIPASVEMFGLSPDVPGPQGPGFEVDCGLRIAGNWSRKPDVMLKHSFSLRFRSRYGAKRLHYALFPDSSVDSFDVLRLRASQADSFMYFADKGQYLHDQWARDTQRAMGWLSPHGIYVHVYVDGLYWGVYNLAEEPTAAFTSDYLGGAESHWDVIKDGPATESGWSVEVEDGSMEAYQAMLDIVASSPQPDPDDPADRQRLAQLSELLDIPQHIDYTLLQIYGANIDWPEKNFRAARDRVAGDRERAARDRDDHGSLGPWPDSGKRYSASRDRFQFFIWDYEHTTALRDDPTARFCQSPKDPATGECGFNADTKGVAGLHGWLSHFPDYRLAFADRVQMHLFDDGALTPAHTAQRYRALADALGPAILGESVRWGTDTPEPRTESEQFLTWRRYTRRHGSSPQTVEMWNQERDRLLSWFFPHRTTIVLGQLCRQGLYPRVNAPRITVDDGRRLRIDVRPDGCEDGTNVGEVYFTLDGSDPRQPWSGDVSPRARRYDGPLRIPGYANVKARVLGSTPQGRAWSAAAETTVGKPRLAITEIMYNPDTGSEHEFLEIKNVESARVDVSGVQVSDAITYSVPAGTFVDPGAHIVVAKDPLAFSSRYPGVVPLGPYDGKLGNGGETITVSHPRWGTLAEVEYDDDGFWPLGPDGMGFSLVPVDPRGDRGDAQDGEAWRASAHVGGSPGRDDPEPAHGGGRIVINEVLASPGENQEDAIELHNRGDVATGIGGWYLSDDRDQLQKFRIPDGTVVPAGGYVAFYARDLGADPDHGFGLSSRGESAFVSSADRTGALSGAVRGVSFGATEAGTAVGRHGTANGLGFVEMRHPTFGVDDPTSVEEFRQGQGAPNAPPRVGPVVISEIMYYPAPAPAHGLMGAGANAAAGVAESEPTEFIELHNDSAAPVSLCDSFAQERCWSFSDGVEFTFPPGATLDARSFVLVVPTEPQQFRREHEVPPDVPVFGPWKGKLSNGGERLALSRPWSPDPYDDDALVLVEQVRYKPHSPWPTSAAGDGPSLERIYPWEYGDDPTVWTALTSGGTPGRPNTEPRRLYLPTVLGHQ
jgi:hypothetical protein